MCEYALQRRGGNQSSVTMGTGIYHIQVFFSHLLSFSTPHLPTLYPILSFPEAFLTHFSSLPQFLFLTSQGTAAFCRLLDSSFSSTISCSPYILPLLFPPPSPLYIFTHSSSSFTIPSLSSLSSSLLPLFLSPAPSCSVLKESLINSNKKKKVRKKTLH